MAAFKLSWRPRRRALGHQDPFPPRTLTAGVGSVTGLRRGARERARCAVTSRSRDERNRPRPTIGSFAGATGDRPRWQPMVARVDHGMIDPVDRPRRVLQMSATPDSTFTTPEQLTADLQRQLAEREAERDEALGERDKAQRRLVERTAERDEALAQQTATVEV